MTPALHALKLEQSLELLWIGVLRDLLDEALSLEVLLDALEHLQLLGVVDHAECGAFLSEPTGTPNAVKVRLRVVHAPLLHGHVVVDDQSHRRHVNSARQHVGRDQETTGASAEVEEDLVSVRLFHAAVEHRHTVAIGLQHVPERLHRLSRVHEDDALPHRDSGEDVRNPLLLFLLPFAHVVHLAHLVVEDVLPLDFYLRPVVRRERRECLGELDHTVRPRRREEERLHLLWEFLA
eukprot:CAMPEP_0113245288 /NCGR_PEP_ID=MMETSP0008_2-20120614/8853_1 /TAXON_ID=97485 /ORGANISM="Prymnesium parvum" /LENGTH=235 /DNA_ID=CAMNT_0000092959 /DNA_START=477 /DNA_END=1181 /DNA_ORIENTATION=+ /assembly_acc=CAM_ASM_000153